MTNEPTPKGTKNNSEFDNFERLAKQLFSLPSNEIEQIKQEEKESGSLPDSEDTKSEEQDN